MSKSALAPPDWLRLNPTLDRAGLRARYEQGLRLHVPEVFTAEAANRIAEALEVATPWKLSLNSGANSMDLDLDELAALPAQNLAEIDRLIWAGAARGFQYAFDAWRISDEVEAGRRISSPVEAVYDFVNSAAFFSLIEDVTGEDRARYCDAQATRYRKSHFLTTHDDAVEGKDRLFAYVLNFTRDWRPDWGGELLFFDEAGHVAAGFTPTFNALNIFRVPQPHAVSFVAPFAQAPRLSITGWIRMKPG